MSLPTRLSRRPSRRTARRGLHRLRTALAIPIAALFVVAGAVAPVTADTGAAAPAAADSRTWVVQAIDDPTQMWVSDDTNTSTVIIAPGDTVEWQFGQARQGHDLVSLDSRTPWPVPVAEYRDMDGAAFNYTFDEPGMYEYECSLHGTLMRGIVVVQEGGGNQSPAAAPVVAPTSGAAPLTVHFTANGVDPDGDALSYLWDFGTGTSPGTANHVMFEYTTPGTYTATLQVSDGRGGTFEQDFPITVTEEGEAPEVSATATPSSGPAPLNVSFTAQAPGEHAQHYTYDWTFGDGATGTGISPAHSYTEPGHYTATVTVTDGQNTLGTADVHVSVTSGTLPAIEAKAAPSANEPRQVAFSADVTTGGTFASYSHGLTVTPDLTGEAVLIRQREATYASIDVTGLKPNGSHLVHVHEQVCSNNLAGAHFRFDETQPFVEENEIWLPFTSDAAGNSGLIEVTQPQRAGDKAVSIVIHDPDNPALRIGCVDLGPETAGLEYTWDFGDGTTGEGPDADHTYTAAGTYTATVTVTDGHGGFETASVQVAVTSGALPTIEAKATSASDGSLQAAFSADVTTGGTFASYSHGLTVTPDLTGEAVLIRQREATYASIDVTGLKPNGSHLVHVHEQVCSNNLAGAHFRFDETQPFVEENEIWLPFTSDAAGNSGLIEVTQPQRAGDKAVSIVIHDPDNPALRIGCVDLGPETAGLEYTWDFGDGTTGEGPDADHTYTAAGTYTATVTVSHTSGGPSVSSAVSVVVGAAVPGAVSGTVSGAGAPVAGACVYLYEGASPDASFASCADAAGAYYISGVAVGEYVVAVADPSGVFSTVWLESPVVVTADRVASVDVELEGSLTGHLVGEVSAAGSPLESVCVFAYERGESAAASFATCTDAAGAYGMYGITAQEYDVAFFDPTGAHVTQWWDGSSTGAVSQAGAGAVAVAGTVTADADMSALSSGVVSGTVTGAGGAPLAGVCVYLYAGAAGPAAYATCTQADGTWWMGDVTAGEYRVAFADHTGGHHTQWFNQTPAGAGSYQDATAVTVTPGTTLPGLDATLAPRP